MGERVSEKFAIHQPRFTIMFQGLLKRAIRMAGNEIIYSHWRLEKDAPSTEAAGSVVFLAAGL